MVTAVTAIPIISTICVAMAASITEERVRVSATFAAKSLGYKKLRDLQMEVILSLVMGKDVFAILPTGYGKSLCYASLPLLLDHLYQPTEKSIVIVVTPLTAIMEDQASQMKQSYCIN